MIKRSIKFLIILLVITISCKESFAGRRDIIKELEKTRSMLENGISRAQFENLKSEIKSEIEVSKNEKSISEEFAQNAYKAFLMLDLCFLCLSNQDAMTRHGVKAGDVEKLDDTIKTYMRYMYESGEVIKTLYKLK